MATAQQMAALMAVVPAAQAAQRKWGVPVSVTLAQWTFESTWGTSVLSRSANNFFGIKARHLAAPDTYTEFPTYEYAKGKRVLVEALFEKYFDAADSFDDHGRLLATSARYRPCMAVAHAPNQFAFQLQHCGYSTNPKYAIGLIAQMTCHNLYQFDAPPPIEPAVAKEIAA